ncbi:MAG: hypothetical protein IJL87_10660 [Clostridia bacterium]|nr:hypothetical protein [Clostridia bacterium]
MIDDIEMLNFVRQNVEMGIDGIQVILKYSKDDAFRSQLESQLEEYRQIYDSADQMLKSKGGKPENINAAAKASAHIMETFKSMTDSSTSHAAESMIKGSTNGITKIIMHQRDYGGGDEKIKELSEKLLHTEQSNVERLKTFL